MIELNIEREVNLDADAVWAVLADFGNVDWVPGIENVEIEGRGVGMIRHLSVPVYPTLHERLEMLDPESMTLDYSIPSVEYISVRDYRARARVQPLEPGRCRLHWSCRAEADGASEEEARQKTRAFYEAMLDWLTDFVEQRTE